MLSIKFELLKNPNLWSYISLYSCKVIIEKVEEIAEEKQKVMNTLEKAKIPYDKINHILENIQQALLNCGYKIKSVNIKAKSFTLVGASGTFGKLPFEVGLHFEPILNIPYIPGSTIKGAIRAGVFDLLLQKGKTEEEAETECKKLFGDNEIAGLIGFTDAYPIKEGVEGKLLYPDVMSPHYTNDTITELNVLPKPVIYPVIAPGTEFKFFLFYKKERGKRKLVLKDSQHSDLVETSIQDINKLGIVDLGLLYSFYRGIGAKTSIGYSRFEILSYENVGKKNE
jgi:CRISPR-associated protein Cmr6